MVLTVCTAFSPYSLLATRAIPPPLPTFLFFTFNLYLYVLSGDDACPALSFSVFSYQVSEKILTSTSLNNSTSLILSCVFLIDCTLIVLSTKFFISWLTDSVGLFKIILVMLIELCNSLCLLKSVSNHFPPLWFLCLPFNLNSLMVMMASPGILIVMLFCIAWLFILISWSLLYLMGLV